MTRIQRRSGRLVVADIRIYTARLTGACAISLAKPCTECDRWLRICEHLGLRIQLFYTNNIGETIIYDRKHGIPHEYKLKQSLW
jgi:hypothetical protein